MGIGAEPNFVIYPELILGGVIETLQQNLDVFNGASQNCIRLTPRRIKGDYEKESYVVKGNNSISHRDPTSTSAVTDDLLAMDEFVGIKVNKRIGPKAMTRDAYRKLNVDPETFSYQFGVQWGVDLAADYVNNAVGAVRAAIANQGNNLGHDATLDTLTTANITALIQGKAKLGDKAGRVKLWVMHSDTYFQLMQQSVTDKIVNVADVTIWQGSVATLGLPALVVDSPSLATTGASGAPAYDVLGLVENAIEIAESEDREVMALPILGLQNIATRIQGEFAYNVRITGCAWDLTNGGVNPTDTQLATPAYWLKKAADFKSMPGVRVTFHQ